MLLIAQDLSKRVATDAKTLEWVPSPHRGVSRRMLERIGDEGGMATSLVRFDIGAAVPRHEHRRGEEVFVLEGIFRDESRSYPTGSYVRSPWGSSHATHSTGGCVILVKHNQIPMSDGKHVVSLPDDDAFKPSGVPGVNVRCLFEHYGESSLVERWAPGTQALIDYPKGGEILVIDGQVADAEGEYDAHWWIRMPAGSSHRLHSSRGCTLWVKRGHVG